MFWLLRRFIVATIAVLIFGLSTGAIARAQEGPLVAGWIPSPPAVTADESGQPTGYFADLTRLVAAEAGFGYSSAMQAKGGDWTPEALDAFLLKPSSDVSGTSMSFSGLKKQSDRVNLIAYLDSLDN